MRNLQDETEKKRSNYLHLPFWLDW